MTVKSRNEDVELRVLDQEVRIEDPIRSRSDYSSPAYINFVVFPKISSPGCRFIIVKGSMIEIKSAKTFTALYR